MIKSRFHVTMQNRLVLNYSRAENRFRFKTFACGKLIAANFIADRG